jgi:hypothetical protein
VSLWWSSLKTSIASETTDHVGLWTRDKNL